MMTRLAALLAFLALAFAGTALAQSAVATTVIGSVQVQTGSASPRLVRQGDEVRQGDTVFTGPNSSVVFKFDDGQIAALTGNSRMTITTYQYNAQARSGSILLSLLNGGMRAITGLIGKVTPERVTYRAATATVGIRGTDVTIVTSLGNVVVTVTEGEISFTFAGTTITVPAGQGVNARTDGTFQQAAAAQIISQLPADVVAAINGLTGLTNAIQQAAPGTPRTDNMPNSNGTPGTSGTTGPTGGGGNTGGTASPS